MPMVAETASLGLVNTSLKKKIAQGCIIFPNSITWVIHALVWGIGSEVRPVFTEGETRVATA